MAFNQLKKWVGTQLWSTFMTEYNENIDELNTHLAESANRWVEESGSNPNGSYIKFGDGTQICTMVRSSLPRGGSVLTFPSLFSELPVIVGSTYATTSEQLIVLGIRSVSNTQATIYPFSSFTGRIEVGDSVVVVAIGRWKQ